MSKSYVYVLVYPSKDAIKVGKADNISNRKEQLKHWGFIDKEKSFFICVDKKDVFKLESSLHFVLKDFKKEMPFADGFTEFFDIECYSRIVDFSELLGFEKGLIDFGKIINDSKYLSGRALRLRKFENKINRYSKSLMVSNKSILLLKKTIRILKKFGYQISLNGDANNLNLFVCSNVFNYKPFVFGVLRLGHVSSLTGDVGVSFVLPSSKDDRVGVDISINNFKTFICYASDIGRADYIHALLLCYDFLKKDLPNESELPKITLNKNNELVISN